MTPTFEHVHTDERGEMYRILLPTGQEVLLLHSKQGSRRGGHSHTVPETVAVVSGKMVYHKLIGRREVVLDYGPGAVSYNLPDEPHYGEFLEDSWVLEFKFGPGCEPGNWENIDYEPFRSLVRESAQS